MICHSDKWRIQDLAKEAVTGAFQRGLIEAEVNFDWSVLKVFNEFETYETSRSDALSPFLSLPPA